MVGDIPRVDSQAATASRGERSPPLCSEHGVALQYFCSPCDVPVCSNCVLIGSHTGHKPVMGIKQGHHLIELRLRKKVLGRARKLHGELLQRVQKDLVKIDELANDLSSRFRQVEKDIRVAGERAIEVVRARVQGNLDELRSVHQTCVKMLSGRRAELSGFAEGLRTLFAFSERLCEQDGDLTSLLIAVDKRARALEKADAHMHPNLAHLSIEFSVDRDVDLNETAQEMVGMVTSCAVPANHSPKMSTRNQRPSSATAGQGSSHYSFA